MPAAAGAIASIGAFRNGRATAIFSDPVATVTVVFDAAGQMDRWHEVDMRLSREQSAGMRLADWASHYARLHGVTPAGHKAWSEEEVRCVVEHFPDYPKIGRLLHWRTPTAIARKAQKLGLTESRRVWLDGQWGAARPPYRRGDPVREVIAPAVNKTARQVWAKAGKAGVRRPRRVPKDTPWPLVNQIRERAFRLGMNMGDLDHHAKTGSYFQRPRRLNLKQIKKAMALLSGRLTVVWADA